ncbi:MAG: UDP-N-acetylglucosamine 1-carboxyvinyltransferase [Chloroflexi bacterium]|nr:UDP-N-acetylglucosamine 1-carboxyvinyltransferase [Chloroflexota bacterium]
MALFRIEGGHPLTGVVHPSGNKNAALPALAAVLLTDEPVILHNVPEIGDVRTMRSLLASLGVQVDQVGPHSWRLHAAHINSPHVDPHWATAIRASILLAGPMLARLGEVYLPPPGGDVIGRRRLDTHILALEALGAQVTFNGIFEFRSRGLRGTHILLDEASVTATENALMAAVLAPGTTVIQNAACEPHVQDVCHLLNAMGAHIEGIGSNVLTIEGVDRLHGAEYTLGPDYVEIGSFIGLGAVSPGELRIQPVNPDDLRMIRWVFERRLNVRMQLEGDTLIIPDEQELRVLPDVGGAIPKIDDAPWPQFPADLMSIALVVATQAEGVILIHEKMFESRLYFVDKLISMGAHIILCDPHRAVVSGPAALHGQRLTSPDIRAGMALLIAALIASGESEIYNIDQIDRGYQHIEHKLQALGAHIQRVESD